jgi:hypothetical protein
VLTGWELLQNEWAGALVLLWLVAGLVTLVAGLWALISPRAARDHAFGLLGLSILASQFLIAFTIAYASGG